MKPAVRHLDNGFGVLRPLLVPDRPLAEIVRTRAGLVADRQLMAVERTMRLEDQAVQDTEVRKEQRDRLINEA